MYYQSVMEPEAMAVLQRTTQILCQLVRVNVGVKLTHRHILGLKHTTAIHHTVPFSSIVLAITHYSRLSRGDFEAILALKIFNELHCITSTKQCKGGNHSYIS